MLLTNPHRRGDEQGLQLCGDQSLIGRRLAIKSTLKLAFNSTETLSIFLVYLLMARQKVKDNKTKQKRNVESGRGVREGTVGWRARNLSAMTSVLGSF